MTSGGQWSSPTSDPPAGLGFFRFFRKKQRFFLREFFRDLQNVYGGSRRILSHIRSEYDVQSAKNTSAGVYRIARKNCQNLFHQLFRKPVYRIQELATKLFRNGTDIFFRIMLLGFSEKPICCFQNQFLKTPIFQGVSAFLLSKKQVYTGRSLLQRLDRIQ